MVASCTKPRKCDGGFVIAGRHAASVLDLAEEALGALARCVGCLVDGPLDLPVRLRRDHRVIAMPIEVRSDGVAIVAFVAGHGLRRRFPPP